MKKGEAKKAKEEQRETLKNKPKMPFSRGKTRFFCSTKQRKERNKDKPPKNKKIINKEGLGPSEVALWATSPDP